MDDSLTFGDYLANPYGRGVGVAPTALIKDTVANALINDYPSEITFQTFKADDRQLIFLCRIPSRTKKAVNYDVVIQLDLSVVEDNVKISIARCPFRCFSNSPSFYYTYANVFQSHDLFCDWLKRKYERKIMRKKPIVRNPSQIVGYERTVYTCMYVILEKTRHKAATDLYNQAVKASYREMAKLIQSQDEVEDAYERAPYTEKVQKQKEETKVKREQHAQKMEAVRRNPQSSPRTSTVSSSARTKKSSRTKKTGFIGKIKSLGKKR